MPRLHARTLLVAALTLVFAQVAPAQSLNDEQVTHITAATVFIKVSSGRTLSSGSGFLVKTIGTTAYIVTNEHVITSRRNPVTDEPGPPVNVEVVWNSGGTKERRAKAAIVARDPDRDLAVLKVDGQTDLPKPFNLTTTPKLVPTTKVFVCGFPFGERLATSEKNPEISIGEASISSVRSDVAGGPVTQIQLNGALNPGNSGGPVVTADGQLVGVAVKTVRAAGIGFAIPHSEVANLLLGKVGQVTLAMPKDVPMMGEIHTQLEATVIDPLKNIKSIAAHILPLSAKPVLPATPMAVAGAKRVPLTIRDGIASADVTIPDGKEKGLFVQIELNVTEGKIFTTMISVPLGPPKPNLFGGPNRSDDPDFPITADGKLRRAGGSLMLPLPSDAIPPGSEGENISVVNAAPEQFVGKAISLLCLTTCVVNQNSRGEWELNIETDAGNSPSDVRVVVPKDLALQLADLGIPELLSVVAELKYPVRIQGQFTKPASKNGSHTLLGEKIELLDVRGKVEATFVASTAAPMGAASWSSVNRFPEQYVGQTLTLEGRLKGTRYAGGTGVNLGNLDHASPLNLDIYTARQLAGQIDSDIPRGELPAKARFTIEVKAVNPRTGKGVVGVTKVELLRNEPSPKTFTTTAKIDYPPLPAAVAPKATDAKKEPTPVATPEAARDAAPKPEPKSDSNAMMFVGIAVGVSVVFGAIVLYVLRSKSPPPPTRSRPSRTNPRDTNPFENG